MRPLQGSRFFLSLCERWVSSSDCDCSNGADDQLSHRKEKEGDDVQKAAVRPL